MHIWGSVRCWPHSSWHSTHRWLPAESDNRPPGEISLTTLGSACFAPHCRRCRPRSHSRPRPRPRPPPPHNLSTHCISARAARRHSHRNPPINERRHPNRFRPPPSRGPCLRNASMSQAISKSEPEGDQETTHRLKTPPPSRPPPPIGERYNRPHLSTRRRPPLPHRAPKSLATDPTAPSGCTHRTVENGNRFRRCKAVKKHGSEH